MELLETAVAITFLFVNLLLLVVSVGLLIHYWMEKKIIRDFAIRAVGGNNEPLKVALALAGEIFRIKKAWRSDQAFIPLTIFSALGKSPASILRMGGCCSDITRLTIVSLNALGFKAGSITVCTPLGEARHCLVEVSLGKHNVLLDATYGVYYVDELGRGLGLSHIQSGARPSFASLPHSNKRGYPSGSYYEFDYRQSKTANWTQSRVRKAVYRVLVFVTKGTIDRVKQPAALEWPQLVLATSLAVFLVSMNLAGLLF